MANTKERNNPAEQESEGKAASVSEKDSEIERLKAQLAEAKEATAKAEAERDELKTVAQEQGAVIEQQTAIIRSTQETFTQLKKSTLADTEAGRSALEANERAKDIVTVFYPMNPLDPQKKHVPVFDHVTGKVVQVQVGTYVDVHRCVKEVLDHSAAADGLTLVLQEKKAQEYLQAEQENKI